MINIWCLQVVEVEPYGWGEPPPPPDLSSLGLLAAVQQGVLHRVVELLEQDTGAAARPDGDGLTLLHWAAINDRCRSFFKS